MNLAQAMLSHNRDKYYSCLLLDPWKRTGANKIIVHFCDVLECLAYELKSSISDESRCLKTGKYVADIYKDWRWSERTV